MNYADLEIGLHRRDTISYTVELRFSHSLSDDEKRTVRSDYLPLARFDTEQVRNRSLDALAYGQYLSDELFADEAVRTAFHQSITTAQTLKIPLRVRLFLGPSVPELHRLRWETLCFPQSEDSLLMSERLLFSRYLSSTDWGTIQLRRQDTLRALVVIANPTNLSTYTPDNRPLAPIDVAGEQARVQASLGPQMEQVQLRSNGSANLKTIMHHLREGCDMLYLVAHGAIVGGESYLWLEDETGQTAVTPGSELVKRMKEVPHMPRLVVLASCYSAGQGPESMSGDDGALAALGPRLAEAGIPAVLAMQSAISLSTVAEFMPVFFEELQRDGQIDRAMAVARGHIRHHHDWWVPVLFLRLKSGRLWYQPTFASTGRGRGDEKWEPLIASIRDRECTPILGSGLTDFWFGSRRQIARQLADDFHFPMGDHHREDLSHVAQYLSIQKSGQFPYRTLLHSCCQEIRQRHADLVPDEWCQIPLERMAREDLLDHLNRLMIHVWDQRNHLPEPHRLLARLPLPIYLTTDPSELLTVALQRAGRDPQVVLSPWNDFTRKHRSIYKTEPAYRPTPERPLVYHLFGRLQDPESLVLTEDDYFNYLIGITRNKNRIPGEVRRYLTDSALLFLGFQMVDWNFRVFFRGLMSQEGRDRRNDYAHVAVQIAPEEDRILEPQGAKRYFEDYFLKDSISIYWGSIDDFAQELMRRWEG